MTATQSNRIQHRLNRLGYASFMSLSSSEIGQLVDAYNSLLPKTRIGFHCSMFSPNPDYRRAVDSAIRKVAVRVVSELFSGYRILYANFMVKEPGPDGDFFVHQDWTYVDETRSQSIALWFPLMDVTADNGALHVVPGSHKMKNVYRGPGVYDPLLNIHEDIRHELGVPIPLKAGEILAWDHRLVHYSLPNISDSARLAATVILIPADEQVLHCRGTEDGKMNIYEVDTEFFMTCSVHELPGGEPLHSFSYTYSALEAGQFKQLCTPTIPWMQWLRSAVRSFIPRDFTTK
jgi:hypothetical protein